MTQPLALFEGFGVEIEYMIVDRETLAVKPIADALLGMVGAGPDGEVAMGKLAWSNELTLHLIELKTNGPVKSMAGLDRAFQEDVRRINGLLETKNACLMPTAMHPWMDPARELKLWPHENRLIYDTLHRIFDCTGHGWANLQSVHLNLAFANDAEFARLHAAVRLVLPIIPALAASSPFVEGRRSAWLDTRAEFYRNNARRIPSVTGRVIPERVYDRQSYEGDLLAGIYDDLAPQDPEGVLRYEWINARGAIARFDRMALEVRLIDVQECPRADMAVLAAVAGAVKALVQQTWQDHEQQQGWDEVELEQIMLGAIRDGDATVIDNERYLSALGFPGARATAGEVWQHLAQETVADGPARNVLTHIGQHGCLSRRIAEAAGDQPSRQRLHSVYQRLNECLERGELFVS